MRAHVAIAVLAACAANRAEPPAAPSRIARPVAVQPSAATRVSLVPRPSVAISVVLPPRPGERPGR